MTDIIVPQILNIVKKDFEDALRFAWRKAKKNIKKLEENEKIFIDNISEDDFVNEVFNMGNIKLRYFSSDTVYLDGYDLTCKLVHETAKLSRHLYRENDIISENLHPFVYEILDCFVKKYSPIHQKYKGSVFEYERLFFNQTIYDYNSNVYMNTGHKEKEYFSDLVSIDIKNFKNPVSLWKDIKSSQILEENAKKFIEQTYQNLSINRHKVFAINNIPERILKSEYFVLEMFKNLSVHPAIKDKGSKDQFFNVLLKEIFTQIPTQMIRNQETVRKSMKRIFDKTQEYKNVKNDLDDLLSPFSIKGKSIYIDREVEFFVFGDIEKYQKVFFNDIDRQIDYINSKTPDRVLCSRFNYEIRDTHKVVTLKLNNSFNSPEEQQRLLEGARDYFIEEFDYINKGKNWMFEEPISFVEYLDNINKRSVSFIQKLNSIYLKKILNRENEEKTIPQSTAVKKKI